MSHGWVKLHRKVLEHPRFKDGDWLKVWVYLLGTATHKERDVIFGKERITLKPGQLVTGRAVICEATGLHRSKVERILKGMKIEHEIEQQTCPKGRLISIANWDCYQSREQVNEQQTSNKRATNEQQTSTNNNDKKVKKVKKKPPAENEDVMERLIAVWNEKTKGVLPTVKHASEERRKRITKKMETHKNLEEIWPGVLDSLLQSDFHIGKEKKWKADFDYMFRISPDPIAAFDERGDCPTSSIHPQADTPDMRDARRAFTWYDTRSDADNAELKKKWMAKNPQFYTEELYQRELGRMDDIIAKESAEPLSTF